MPVTETPTIRARIREALKGEPDPRVVAANLVQSLPESELRAALATALPYLVADEVRKARHDAIGKPHPHETTGQDGGNRVAHMDDSEPPPADAVTRYDVTGALPSKVGAEKLTRT